MESNTESNTPAVIDGATAPTTQDQWLTPSQVVARLQLVKETMRLAMQPGVHYGTIPGCGPKPALLKPGAEVLCQLCQLAPAKPEIDIREFNNGHREYTITVNLVDQRGNIRASGTGSCSTLEKKYRYIKGQERAEIADVYNTVLKMAHKRAFVGATLLACNASDLFTADIDEPHIAETVRESNSYAAPDPNDYPYAYEFPYKKSGPLAEMRAFAKKHGARWDADNKVWITREPLPQEGAPIDNVATYLVAQPDVEQAGGVPESFEGDEFSF